MMSRIDAESEALDRIETIRAKAKEPIDGKYFIGKMHKKGVLMVSGGTGVRIFPPLVISQEMQDTGLDILESVIQEVNAEYYKK